jgi:hypothetical protein
MKNRCVAWEKKIETNGFALRRWEFRRTKFQPTTKAKSEN